MLKTLCDTLGGLIEAASQLQRDAPTASQLNAIVTRGTFRPDEDEAIGYWFARFLSVRESLWAVIEEVITTLDGPADSIESERDLRFFLLGYAAVCILIRIDRMMLFDVAHHSIIQRKLNEAFPEYRIPRKQYTTIFSAFVDQRHVLAIRDAMNYARKHRRRLVMLGTDKNVGFIARQIDDLESSLNASPLDHLRRAWSYVSHKWRRRGVVSAKTIMAGVMEGVGRTASRIFDANNKHVTSDILGSIAAFLEPGDVIVTRHAKALTNLFIPGFWPHAALYVGTREQHEIGAINMTPTIDELWANDICVLEARKDGVLLRPLTDTLAVDTFVVLRPNLDAQIICRAIERALSHEGKMYNFDFDFFSSDRVVCTEVVYRAYDGLEGVRFPLNERAGRKTLSAEDLLDFALDTRAFTPVAIFGVENCKNAVVYGDGVRDALIESYRGPL
jgi:hypothetical protein